MLKILCLLTFSLLLASSAKAQSNFTAVSYREVSESVRTLIKQRPGTSEFKDQTKALAMQLTQAVSMRPEPKPLPQEYQRYHLKEHVLIELERPDRIVSCSTINAGIAVVQRCYQQIAELNQELMDNIKMLETATAEKFPELIKIMNQVVQTMSDRISEANNAAPLWWATPDRRLVYRWQIVIPEEPAHLRDPEIIGFRPTYIAAPAFTSEVPGNPVRGVAGLFEEPQVSTDGVITIRRRISAMEGCSEKGPFEMRGVLRLLRFRLRETAMPGLEVEQLPYEDKALVSIIAPEPT